MSRTLWPLVLAVSSVGATCSKRAPDDGTCLRDSECASNEVCARDGECWGATHVRMVHLTWTLRSLPANAPTCAAAPELEISFYGAEQTFGFAHVSCISGMFTVDKLPRVYTRVGLARAGEAPIVAEFDTTGSATIDLQ